MRTTKSSLARTACALGYKTGEEHSAARICFSSGQREEVGSTRRRRSSASASFLLAHASLRSDPGKEKSARSPGLPSKNVRQPSGTSGDFPSIAPFLSNTRS